MKAYASRYLGLRSVIEFVARKAQVLSSETPEARILNAVRTTATKEDYGYSRFGEFKISSIHDGTVEGRHVEFETVYAAIRDSLRVDRAAQLRRVFGLISEGARNEEDVLLRCLTFSQRHFFHHFAGQPLQRNGVSVLDPIASLMIGTARCGSSARFLVDLFECQGISARLITGACHTSAEVRIGDRWLLADASLYPPGVHPISSDGRWLTLDEAAEDPGLLDRVPNYINYHHEYIDRFVASYPEYSDGEDIRLLRTPILPSSGYFSSDILRAGNRGVERLKKVGAVADWVGDLDFGWSQGFEKQTLEVRGVETVFRPGQARGIVRAGAKLVWRAADRYAAQQPVRYRVVGRDAPRGWEYDRLSSGCRFDVSGNSTVVDTNEMPEGSARSLGRFITIFSEIAKADEGRFYLPSTEFDLDRIP